MIAPLDATGLLWTAWLVGWAIASFTAAKSVVRQPVSGRLTHGLLVVAGAILIMGQNPRLAPLMRPVYPSRAWIGWVGVAVCAIGLAFAVWARVQIGRFWSGAVALKAEHALIRGGPYAITRHPIYSGLLLALLGTAITRDTQAAFLGLPFLFAGLIVKAKQEERLLLERFGPEYEKYRAEVPALIPRV
jgi:protein-S-isoprenylcysteine O-methyltransferase Ste14